MESGLGNDSDWEHRRDVEPQHIVYTRMVGLEPGAADVQSVRSRSRPVILRVCLNQCGRWQFLSAREALEQQVRALAAIVARLEASHALSAGAPVLHESVDVDASSLTGRKPRSISRRSIVSLADEEVRHAHTIKAGVPTGLSPVPPTEPSAKKPNDESFVRKLRREMFARLDREIVQVIPR